MLGRMPLTQDHINELKEIYKGTFGEDLTNEEAWEIGTRLVNLFRLLLQKETRPFQKQNK